MTSRVLVTIDRDGRGRQHHSGQGKCPVLHGRGGGSFLHLVYDEQVRLKDIPRRIPMNA